MVQLLCHLCGHEIARNAVLNAANAKAFVNFIHQEIQQQVVSSVSLFFSGVLQDPSNNCLLLVRNLSFSRSFLHHLMAKPDLLQELLLKITISEADVLTSQRVSTATLCTSILSILVVHGEKVRHHSDNMPYNRFSIDQSLHEQLQGMDGFFRCYNGLSKVCRRSTASGQRSGDREGIPCSLAGTPSPSVPFVVHPMPFRFPR